MATQMDLRFIVVVQERKQLVEVLSEAVHAEEAKNSWQRTCVFLRRIARRRGRH